MSSFSNTDVHGPSISLGMKCNQYVELFDQVCGIKSGSVVKLPTHKSTGATWFGILSFSGSLKNPKFFKLINKFCPVHLLFLIQILLEAIDLSTSTLFSDKN